MKIRRRRPLSLALGAAAALLAGAALASPEGGATKAARADTATASPAPAKPAAGAAKAAATQPAATQPAKAGARKVWTMEDLAALRAKPGASVLVLETRELGNGPMPVVRTEQAVSPQDVVNRYDELAREAQARLDQLQRERLAASNPYLRGLASATGGPRSIPEIEADIEQWRGRRDAAAANRDRASRLTGAEPEAPEPEPSKQP